MIISTRNLIPLVGLAFPCLAALSAEPARTEGEPPVSPLVFINTTFENASPLFWEINESGEVEISLMYDHERSSPNRAAGHWHFRVEASQGSNLTLTGGKFRTPGSIGEGLLERYGVHACVHELNANRIAGLDDYPSAENWKLYGEQLCEVFYRLFQSR